MIEEKVKEIIDDKDEIDWLEELGRDLSDYVDIDGVARDVVDHDGIGSLSSYDGEYDDIYITGPDGTRHDFVILRMN
jgi:antirestriction protein